MQVRLRRHPRRGLTLLEMLVTLVLLSLIVTLLAQILLQAQSMERLLQRHGASDRQVALRLAWLGDAIEGLTPVPLNDPRPFRGTAQGFEGMSAMRPWHGSAGPQPLRWELRRDPKETSLWAVADTEEPALRLLSWEGLAGGWSYLDEEGNWLENWPPPPVPGTLKGLGLPVAVRLKTGLPRHEELIWLPKASALALTNRRALEQ